MKDMYGLNRRDEKVDRIETKKTAGAREKIAPVVFLICAGNKSKPFVWNVGGRCDNSRKTQEVFSTILGKGSFACMDVCLNRLYACI